MTWPGSISICIYIKEPAQAAGLSRRAQEQGRTWVCRRDHEIRSNLSLDPTIPHHALHPPVCDGTLPEVKEFPG